MSRINVDMVSKVEHQILGIRAYFHALPVNTVRIEKALQIAEKEIIKLFANGAELGDKSKVGG